jgi:hypothetical protein
MHTLREKESQLFKLQFKEFKKKRTKSTQSKQMGRKNKV